MSLRELGKTNFYGHVLDVGKFAETCTFYPADGGEPRVIVAKINHERRGKSQPHVEGEEERLRVAVGRDAAHAKGGIATPVIGDALVREGETELVRYAWTGEIENQTSYSWTLIYTRPRGRRVVDARRG
ncbi:MAG: hypothetical protein AB7G51_13810 [Steroidobacteraceae bacterium]